VAETNRPVSESIRAAFKVAAPAACQCAQTIDGGVHAYVRRAPLAYLGLPLAELGSEEHAAGRTRPGGGNAVAGEGCAGVDRV
jgi:hypothetical protein